MPIGILKFVLETEEKEFHCSSRSQHLLLSIEYFDKFISRYDKHRDMTDEQRITLEDIRKEWLEQTETIRDLL